MAWYEIYGVVIGCIGIAAIIAFMIGYTYYTIKVIQFHNLNDD